jgi:hypothetical protein
MEKIIKVVEISNEMNYTELNIEFWIRQPAIVISLIYELREKCNG